MKAPTTPTTRSPTRPNPLPFTTLPANHPATIPTMINQSIFVPSHYRSTYRLTDYSIVYFVLRRLVQVVSRVFGAFERNFQCQALVRHFIHPHAGRNGDSPLIGSTGHTIRGCSRNLSAKLPAFG